MEFGIRNDVIPRSMCFATITAFCVVAYNLWTMKYTIERWFVRLSSVNDECDLVSEDERSAVSLFTSLSLVQQTNETIFVLGQGLFLEDKTPQRTFVQLVWVTHLQQTDKNR